MNRLTIYTATLALGLLAPVATAAPKFMITHNLTNVQTNAFVDSVPAPFPTKPNSSSRTGWVIVKMGCSTHAAEGICPAQIKMATDTPSPVVVGTVFVDLESGNISPGMIAGGGYTLTVNGPGEITLTTD